MATRRALGGGLPGQASGGMSGAGMPARMPQPPRMAMGGAPPNGAPGGPGPMAGAQGGAAGGPMGMPGTAPVPPPAQPMAGGPTAPANAGSMIVNGLGQQPGMPGQGVPSKSPLPIWAQQGGNTGEAPGGDASGMPPAPGAVDPFELMGAGGGADGSTQAMSPAMLLKLLQASGKLPAMQG